MRNIRQNLFLAFVYNALGVPVAAGVLYPLLGIAHQPDLGERRDDVQLGVGHRERAAAAARGALIALGIQDAAVHPTGGMASAEPDEAHDEGDHAARAARSRMRRSSPPPSKIELVRESASISKPPPNAPTSSRNSPRGRDREALH